MTLQNNDMTDRRSRGAAMLLVLIAVAMCTIMALSFLAAQRPTAAVASNIDRKTQARAIAESALKMAIDYVNEDADWRSDKTSGTWMADIALDGGTFTLIGTDEDDGDLADDTSEAVLLTVVATYDGVTHRVSARVTPGAEESSTNRLLLVAGRGTNPSSTDQYKRDMFESWGYVVTVIDDSDSQATYDAAVAVNDVVFVSEEVNSGSVNTKLRGVTIGVVNDEPYLHDDFGFSSSNSGSGSSSDSIDIVDNTHPITAGFSIGSLTFYNSSINVRYITGSMPSGVTVLADRSGSGTNAIFAAADVGDTLRYGPAAGRRVMFLSTGDLNVNNLNADGQTLLQRSIAWAAGGGEVDEGPAPTLLALYEFEQVEVAPTLAARWPLDEIAVAGAGTVQISGDLTLNNGSYIDAYSSTAGVYGGANQQLDASFSTNQTGNDDVTLNGGSQIYGDVLVGDGADPSSVIQLNNNSQITGQQAAQTDDVTIPTYDTPSGFGSHSGNETYNGGSRTWSSDQHFNKLTLNSNAKVYVSGDVEVRVSNKMEINDGDIILNAGASLTLWIGHNVTVNNGSTINNDTSRAGDLTLIQYGNNRDFELNDGVVVGAIHVADDLTINNGSQIYGNVIVEDKLTINDGSIHVDLASSAPGGGAVYPTTTEDTSDLANDGTIQGQPALGVAGQLGTAFDFDGDDDYIEIPHHDSYLMQGGTFSVWFKPDSTSGRQGLFSKDSTSYDTGGHFSVFLDGARVEVRMQSTTQSYYVYSPTGSIDTGTWYHIMFAWGEEGMALYLDGVLVDDNTYTGGLGTTSGGIGNYEPIVLGGNAWQSGDLVATPVKDHFDGTMDDLRIYNERLTESQALEIFNGAIEPSPFQSESIVEDTSGYGDPLTLSITQTDEVTWADGAVTFTGDAHATSLLPATKLHDAIEATGAFAVEVIMQRATPGTTASPSRIISYADGTNSHNFMLGQDDDHYEARVRDTSTGTNGTLSPEFISDSAISSGDTHIVLSYNEGEVSVFIDGVLDETNTAGGVLNNWEDDFYLIFGGAYGGGNHWQGTLKRVAIYDNAFNAIQADNVFNGNDPGSGASGVSGTGSVQWDEVD